MTLGFAGRCQDNQLELKRLRAHAARPLLLDISGYLYSRGHVYEDYSLLRCEAV
jgi:hypothetical protein